MASDDPRSLATLHLVTRMLVLGQKVIVEGEGRCCEVSAEPIPTDEFASNYPHRWGRCQDGRELLLNHKGEALFQLIPASKPFDDITFYSGTLELRREGGMIQKYDAVERADMEGKPALVEERELYADADINKCGIVRASKRGYRKETIEGIDGLCDAAIKARLVLAEWQLPSDNKSIAFDLRAYSTGEWITEITTFEEKTAEYDAESAKAWAKIRASTSADGEWIGEIHQPKLKDWITSCMPHRLYRLNDGAEALVSQSDDVIWIRHGGYVSAGDRDNIHDREDWDGKQPKYIYRYPEDIKNGLMLLKCNDHFKKWKMDPECWLIIYELIQLECMAESWDEDCPLGAPRGFIRPEAAWVFNEAARSQAELMPTRIH